MFFIAGITGQVGGAVARLGSMRHSLARQAVCRSAVPRHRYPGRWQLRVQGRLRTGMRRSRLHPLGAAAQTPQLNGAVERAQGSWRHESYACFDLPHSVDHSTLAVADDPLAGSLISVLVKCHVGWNGDADDRS